MAFPPRRRRTPEQGRKYLQMKTLGKSALILLISLILGFLLLFAVYHIPARFTVDECVESAPYFTESGEYPTETYSQRLLDNYADCVMLLEASYLGEESALEQVVNSYHNTIQDSNPYYSFRRMYSGSKKEILSTSYARYWHGYLTVLRPLFTKLNYQQIIQINLWGQYILLLLVLFMVCRKAPSCLFPLIITVLFLAPSAIGRCLEYSPAYIITLLFLLLFLWNPGGRINEKNVWVLFLSAGILCGYFDLLTAPSLTLTIPLCFVCVQRAGSGSWKQNAGLFLRCCFVWLFGYAGMWAGKWILTALFEGSDFLHAIWERIWMYTGPTLEGKYIAPLTALGKNLTELFKIIDLDIFAVVFAGILIIAVVHDRRRISKRSSSDALLVFLPALIPVVWVLLLKNHSHRHYWFVYRSLVPLIFCPLCALNTLRNPETAAARSLI